MSTDTHIVLVPGFWLGAWAWDEVAAGLRARGHRVTPVTLPGLESPGADRAAVSFDDHVGAVLAALDTVGPAGRTVLVGHSGAAPLVYAVTDRAPGRVDRAVYVDSVPPPAGSAPAPDLDPGATELPLPGWEELEAGGDSLAGLGAADLERFRARAVPHPAAPARTPLRLADERRYAVPTTVISTSIPAATVQEMVRHGHPAAAELARLPVEYLDLPTGHWPMFSRPADLADRIDAAARA